MSDFKIVKCKKCDASLVELAGEKVQKCEQCGYKFHTIANGSNPYTVSKRLKASPEYKRYLKKIKMLRDNKTTKAAEATEYIPKKKKANIIGKIIFFVILFNILRGVFDF